MLIKALDLVSHTRFDVVLKYMYAKSIYLSYDTAYHKKIYKEHLRVWNNFIEYDNPAKINFQNFDEAFKVLIESISESGFNRQISEIPVYKNKYILNGSHRLAASLLNNNDVSCKVGIDRVDGMLDCNYQFFRKLGLNDDYCDSVALEYSKLKSNTFVVILFPAAKGSGTEVYNLLSQFGNIVYDKKCLLNETGAFNLLREVYLGEAWAGDFTTNFSGIKHKQSLCYPDYSETTSFLVEFTNIKDAILVKEKIRELFDIGNHSIHINDSHEETIRLAKLFFNKNSIHHLNNMQLNNFLKFNESLRKFKSEIEVLNLDIDDYCITASSVLSAYGLREGDDLDYLHFDIQEIIDQSNLIHSHNQYGIGRYHLSRDDIIFNPENHFYHLGVKFASLDVIKRLKAKRGESKDLIDLELINMVLE